MPIDPRQAVGLEFTGGRTQWSREDIVLYHLSLGAGNPPTEPRELDYVGLDELKVLPSFGVVPTSGITGMLHTLPGLDFNPESKVHGEQDVTIHGDIPLDAKVTNTIRVAGVYDKGSGAVVLLEIETRDEAGTLLFTNLRASFIRGEGGFGGDPGPKATIAMPDRKPDLIAEALTLPQQAFLYTLGSGDADPIHTDPVAARRAGFDKPILHGLCTLGSCPLRASRACCIPCRGWILTPNPRCTASRM